MPADMMIQTMQMNMSGVRLDGKSGIILGQGNQDGQPAGIFNDILKAVLSGLEKGLGNLKQGLTVNADGKTVTLDELLQKLFAEGDNKTDKEGSALDMLQQVMAQLQMAGVQPAVILTQDNHSLADGTGNENLIPPFPPLVKRGEEGLSDSGTQKIDIRTGGDSFAQVRLMAKADGQQPGQQQPVNEKENDDGVVVISDAVPVKKDVLFAVNAESREAQHVMPPVKDGITVDNSTSSPVKSDMSTGQSKGPFINISNERFMANEDLSGPRNVSQGQEETAASCVKTALNIESIKISPVVDTPADNEPGNNGNKTSSKELADTLPPTVQVHQTPYSKDGFAVKETVHVSRLNELSEPIMKTLGAGDRHMIIKLEPPDLGSIQIRLRMDNGVLRADFRVDSPAVKDMFSMAMPQIRESLENSGIRAGEFFVDVKDEFYSDGREQRENAQQQQQQRRDKEPEHKFFDFFA
ncbi:MAG: flagellar hook-length control protein FliK [Nitrospirae bacterium]|nr:flagellar hook-length control protein FliK [Nitrospirota bacterium]MCL5237178.1 flagellar hook-length control protein FliK [Nitrospirota bacterium]